MASNKLSQRVKDLSGHIENLRIKCRSDPAKVAEILPNALEEMQACLKDLSSADELRGNEEALNTFSLSASENIAISIDGLIIEANAQFARLLGYDLPEVVGKSVTSFLDPQEHGRVKKIMESGKEYTGEFLALNKDGSTIPIEAHVHSIDREGKRAKVAIIRDITERKQMERALQESEEKFRLIANFTYDCESWLDTKGDLIYISPSCERITGHSAEDFMKNHQLCLEMVHPDDRAAFKNHHNTHLSQEHNPEHIDFRIITAKGETRWINHLCQPVFRKSGEWLGYRVSNRDITERKQMERALRESNERFRLALKNAPVSVAAQDMNLRFLWAYNQRTVNPDEVIGKTDHDVFIPEDATRLISLKRKALETGKEVREQIWLTRNGKPMFLDLYLEPMRDVAGDVTGIGIATVDLTERKRAEEALRASEAELRSLFTAMSDVIIVLDTDGRYLKIAPTSPSHLYRPAEDLIGKTLHDVFPLPLADRYLGYIRQALDTHEIIDIEYDLAIAGQILWFAGTISPISDDKVLLIARDISKSKQAEEELRKAKDELEFRVRERTAELEESIKALRESEEHYRALAEDSPDAIARFDRQMRHLYLNAAGERVTGLPAKKVLGKTHRELGMPVEITSVIEENLPNVFATSKPVTIDYLYTGTAGIGYYETRFIPELAANGAVESVLTITRDITERKRAEDELRSKDAELQLVADTTPVVLTRLSRDLRYVFVNRACAKLFGLAREEIVGKHIAEIMGEEAFETIRPYFEKVLQGEPVEYETEIPYKEIGNRFMHVVYMPERNGQSDVVGWITSVQDITERKRTEDSLRNSEERLRLAQQAAKIGAFEWNIQTGVNTWTPELEAMYGLRPGEFGKTERMWEQLVHPDDLPNALRLVEHAFETGEPVEGEWRVAWPDGSVHWLTGRWQVFKDAAGQPMRMIGVNMDITERKLAEDALVRAKEAAEAATKAKSEFLATMSHEIRTPMNAVIGMASILKETNMDQEQRECIETIDSSGHALLSVINDILDFSGIEKGKLKLGHQPFNIQSCIDEALGMVVSLASKKGLKLSYHIDGSVPERLVGDPSRLRQILTNLLANAVKFTEKGEIVICIKAAKLEDNSYEIGFDVMDTGIGISQKCLNNLFEPFSQGDSSTTRKYGGTGLGLAICKKLVELMGGKIWAESIPNKGSTFRFTIQADVPKGSQEAMKLPLARLSAPVARKDLSILVAEDNPVNQRTAVLMLRKLGYKADAVTNGLEVLQALERQLYDIIFMDIEMPEMDGIEATRAIRRIWPEGPKIIAVTAYALQGDREKCLDAGMDDYIAKPVERAKLVDILEKFQNCQKSGREPCA